jgi:putative ATP-dependent endonuclease of OLD family
MKLRQLLIHNYRSIRDLTLNVPDMLVLIGPNNHGKSNILRAIEFGLSASAKPDREDFFACREDGDDELWVEMIFGDLTDQERRTFQKYLRPDATIRVRKSARLQDNGSVNVEYRGYVQEPDQSWLKKSAFERLSSRERIEQEVKEVPELRPLLDGEGRINRERVDEFQREYITTNRDRLSFTEELETGPLLGRRNVGGGVLPDFFLVPAVRDLTEEIRVKGTTTFGRLLQRAVTEMAEQNEQFVEARNRLRELVGALNARPEEPAGQTSSLAWLEATLTSELAYWGVTTSIEVTEPELERIFELGTRLHVDDGLKTPAERKGHGLQRALLFALIRAWAKSLRLGSSAGTATPRRSSDSVFFAIEEPELFLHPQAQRQLMASLADIAETPGHQVFVTTHSTHFVDLDHYERLAVVTKADPTDGTRVRQCAQELFAGEEAADRKRRFHMAAWVNPDRGELFFARKVVLVEGEAEKAVLPFLARRIGCFDPNVSVIDCGSKHNLPLYIEVLNAFRIPYCVIHDEDPLDGTKEPEQTGEKLAAKRRTFEMNQTIQNLVKSDLGEVEMMKPDFETVAEIPKSQAEKKGKALAALDHFEPMDVAELPERIVQVVQTAYRVRD